MYKFIFFILLISSCKDIRKESKVDFNHKFEITIKNKSDSISLGISPPTFFNKTQESIHYSCVTNFHNFYILNSKDSCEFNSERGEWGNFQPYFTNSFDTLNYFIDFIQVSTDLGYLDKRFNNSIDSLRNEISRFNNKINLDDLSIINLNNDFKMLIYKGKGYYNQKYKIDCWVSNGNEFFTLSYRQFNFVDIEKANLVLESFKDITIK